MKIPRDLHADDLISALEKLGYRADHQTGSHVRLTTSVPSTHHITVPRHNPLKLGTLNAILRDVAAHAQVSKEQVMRTLFGG